MSFAENRVKEYEQYLPPLTKRPDFDSFWAKTTARSDARERKPSLTRVPYPSAYVEVYDLSYNGFDGTRIHGWFLLPAFLEAKKLPVLIQYHGFGQSRGAVHQHLPWVMLGMAVIAVDCRRQGGLTGDRAAYLGGMVGNAATLGILDKKDYYYRGVYMDCRRAIGVATELPQIDPGRIVLNGISQGGGIAIAVAALDYRVRVVLADVPGCSDLEARVEGEHGTFAAVSEYLRRNPAQIDKVFETLSYFDTMNMADKILCPVFASVGGKDTMCPAKCFYATYNRITAPKQIAVYPLSGHEGCDAVQTEKKFRCLMESGIIPEQPAQG